MTTLNERWMEVFRVPRGGETGGWSEAEVRTMAEIYDPAVHESPLTVGHPKSDAPAYGWTKALRARETPDALVLEALSHQVEPQFDDLVRAGRFKKRSIAIYPPEESPIEGKPYLRHIGFLGAAPPAVKGLKPVQFGDAEYIEFAVNHTEERMDKDNKEQQLTHEEVSTLRQFVERLKKLFTGGDGNGNQQTFTEADVQKRITTAVEPFEEKLKKFEEQLATAKKESETQRTQTGAADARAKVRTFIERLTAGGKWVPAFSKTYGLDRLLEKLAGAGDVKLTFTEKKDGKDVEVEKTDYEVLTRFLEDVPKIVHFGELVPAGAMPVPGGDAAAAGANIRQSQAINIDRAMRVKALQRESAKKGKQLTYAEAREIVVAEEIATGQQA